MEFKHFHFKAEDISDDGTFTGWASVSGVKDLGGDIVMPGAFADSLKDISESGNAVPLLWQHDSRDVRGVWRKLEERDRGLWGEGELNLDTEGGKEARSLLKQGAISGLSIGYDIPRGGGEYDAKQEAFLINKANLWEVSLVTFPMNTLARVAEVKSKLRRGDVPTVRDIERALHELGFSAQRSKMIASLVASGMDAEADEDQRRDGVDSEAIATAMAGLLESLTV